MVVRVTSDPEVTCTHRALTLPIRVSSRHLSVKKQNKNSVAFSPQANYTD
jgi:hypothetical protein